jgi:hypothetical protein
VVVSFPAPEHLAGPADEAAEHPDQRALLVEDPARIPGAIEELLRYEAPSPVQARYVTRDVEHYGQTVPGGSAKLLLTASANRDERRFSDPDQFDVQRKIDHHVTFGYGIHFCLGAALARLEGRVALDEVLKRFPTLEIDWDNAVQARTSTVRAGKAPGVHLLTDGSGLGPLVGHGYTTKSQRRRLIPDPWAVGAQPDGVRASGGLGLEHTAMTRCLK